MFIFIINNSFVLAVTERQGKGRSKIAFKIIRPVPCERRSNGHTQHIPSAGRR